MAAAAAKWMLLDPYVFRADDDESFPDDTVAPIKASGTTSWGAGFRVALALADPPSISRLYAQLPGFPGPDVVDPLHFVATHRDLALLSITASPQSRDQGYVQDFFIFKANGNSPSSSSLRRLPPCTVPQYDFRGDLRRRRKKPTSDDPPRLLDPRSSGLWCGGEEFVVAELTLCVPADGLIRKGAFADICSLRSSDQDGQWDTTRVQILPTTDDDLYKLSRWQTDAVIPFRQWLCWISYHHGILFCDVSKKVPVPPVSLFWFPPDEYSLTSTIKTPCSSNGGVSVVDHGRLLKFAYVARHDRGPAYGPLKPGTGFTITCHTLDASGSGSMEWNLDYAVTSAELPDRFQRGLPMYPRVDMDRPHVVHFLFIEFPKNSPRRKMSVLSIDMSKNIVESCYLYMDENEPDEAEDFDFFIARCLCPNPAPFLSCEIPRFCNVSRKRKDME